MAGLDANAAELEIETRHDAAGLPVIAVAGDLDISNSAKVEAAVTAIAAARPEQLVFDLSGLRFMDSAGIAVLLGAVSLIGAVSLREPSPAVRRVLEITGLADVITIEP